MEIVPLILLWSLLVNLLTIVLSMFDVIKNPMIALVHLAINLAAVVGLTTLMVIVLTVGYFIN